MGDKSAFRGAGVALGAVLAMQALSALYYFMFLAIALAVMVAVLFAAIPAGDKRRLVSGLVVAAVVALAVVVPYSRPYSRVRQVVGTRSAGEVAQFSGQVSDYARGGLGRWEHKPDNSGEERVLSPGLLAPALAVVALWPPLDAWRVASAAVLAVAFDGSLGTNGYLFGAARGLVPALDGLRAAARFAVVVLLVLAMLAAIGLARLLRHRSGWTMGVATVVAIAACTVDFWAAPVKLRYPVTRPTPLTVFLAALPPGTILLHLPVPKPAALWANETTYQYWSTFHWQPLVNGYSAYSPTNYVRTLNVLRTFPDAESIGRLRRLKVGYVVVHPAHVRQARLREDRVGTVGERRPRVGGPVLEADGVARVPIEGRTHCSRRPASRPARLTPPLPSSAVSDRQTSGRPSHSLCRANHSARGRPQLTNVIFNPNTRPGSGLPPCPVCAATETEIAIRTSSVLYLSCGTCTHV